MLVPFSINCPARNRRRLHLTLKHNNKLDGFSGWNTRSLFGFLNVAYFYLTAPAGGSSAAPIGWVKFVFVIYILLAMWLIALIFDAFIRRAGTSR